MEVLVRAFNEQDVRAGLPVTFNTFGQARATLDLGLRLGDPLVAVRGTKLVGVALSYRRGGYVCVGPVAVHPLTQGRGVGRELMETIHAEHADAVGFALSQAGTNPAAFGMYRRMGYRVVEAEAVLSGRPEVVRGTSGVSQAAEADVVFDLDRELCGVDRSRDLELLAAMGRILHSEHGYVVCVPLGPLLAIGPAAARDERSLEALLAAALGDAPDEGAMARVPANGAGFGILAGWGLRVERLGNVMIRGRGLERRGEWLYPIFPEVL